MYMQYSSLIIILLYQIYILYLFIIDSKRAQKHLSNKKKNVMNFQYYILNYNSKALSNVTVLNIFTKKCIKLIK